MTQITLTLLIIISIFPSASFASKKHNNKFEAERIEKLVRKIDEAKKEFHLVKKDIYGDPLENEPKKIYRLGSVLLKGFYKDNTLQKMEVEFEGDRETLIFEYYFVRGSLLYAEKTYQFFDPPKWADGPKKIETTKSSFYFEKGKLLFFIENGKKIVSPKELEKNAQLFLKNTEYYQKKLSL